MKKIAAICFLFSVVSLSFAQTCPAPKDVFFKRDGKLIVVAPPGWRVAVDKRETSDMLSFSVAAWGDHLHNTDPVRCHYYKTNKNYVQLDTVSMLPESAFESHPEWGGTNGDHYFLCTGSEVSACPFG